MDEAPHREPVTLVLALAAVGAALVAMFGSDDSFTWPTVIAALVGLVPWALVAGGVHVPLVAFAAWSLACAAVIVAVDVNPGGMFPLLIAVGWIARSSPSWWLNATVLVGGFGLLVIAAVRQGSTHEAGLVYFAGGLGISWLMGQMLRRQEALTVELREMNELRVEHAAAEERARIARDVHDVVAHSLTVVMLHLTGARRALASDPARADEALARAETVGRESLESIRQVMGLLRDDSDDRAVDAPGVAELMTLIDGYRAGGLTVDATVTITAALDPAGGAVVYRVVQESLTNALRHAGGSSCVVELRDGPGSVSVEVVNGPGASAGVAEQRIGLGLRGMAERVRALGGRFDAGPTDDGGWRVAATIPARGVAGDQALPEVTWPQPIVR